MEKLSTLPNIGTELENRLNNIGITTYEQLCDIGAKLAWTRIRETDPSACYNLLCALEGAIKGVRWHSLPLLDKQDLRVFYDKHKNPLDK